MQLGEYLGGYKNLAPYRRSKQTKMEFPNYVAQLITRWICQLTLQEGMKNLGNNYRFSALENGRRDGSLDQE